jgi:hypothetical protein
VLADKPVAASPTVVPENNRARGLYESEGWTADGGVTTEEILGVTVTDIRYRRTLTAAPGG